VGHHQFDHFARAHKQHLDVFEVFKQLTGQAHRGGCHADGVRANLGRAAHLFGDSERALKQLIERGAQGPGFGRGAHRVFHLAQDLWLAQHHRVEATGHAKGVAGGIGFQQGVSVAFEVVCRHAA